MRFTQFVNAISFVRELHKRNCALWLQRHESARLTQPARRRESSTYSVNEIFREAIAAV